MTPGVPADLVREYVRAATTNHLQAAGSWDSIESAAGLVRRDTLLDLGCGTAGFLVAAGGAFGQAIGVDIAFRWLVVARKRLEETGSRHRTLVCACAEHLPFRPGTFDLAVAEGLIDHLDHQPAFAVECARVLRKPDGVLHLSAPNRYSLGPDPHTWIWGVGFLPAPWQAGYVRWRKGIPRWPMRPVSYRQVRRLLSAASLRVFHTELPGFEDRENQASGALRMALRCYGRVRRLPVFRALLCLVGPGFRLLCRPRESGPG
jgi:SAM-dependent methyltransferase